MNYPVPVTGLVTMHVQKMQTEWQTVEDLIRLQEQSDLGLHCLLRLEQNMDAVI